MARAEVVPTGIERRFDTEELIVSKTDLKGVITYANATFMRVSGYTGEELLGAPHSLIRHPMMPGGVFRYLWQTIAAGHEVFALVNNLAKDGANYWVLAHVTPTRDASGRITGYHSNRRCPARAAVEAIQPLYERLRAVEQRHQRRADAAQASHEVLLQELAEAGLSYDEFIWDLIRRTAEPAGQQAQERVPV